MRTTLAAATLLFFVLTWLLFRGINPEAQRFDRLDRAFDRFASIERTIQRDLLSARAGILRNYDSLVQETNALRLVLDVLRENAGKNQAEKDVIDKLAETIAPQEELTEQFKSNNALLQNSLAYFGMFSGRLIMADRNARSLPAVSALSAAMLHLTLDTSTGNVGEVETALRELAGQISVTSDPDSANALLAHGNLLRELLPASDRLLRTLFALPARAELDDVRRIVLVDRQAARQKASQFRFLQYAVSLLLVGLLVLLGAQLRARVFSLRWRARLEHVIAGISTSLIGCDSRELGTRVEQALGRLAECVGADRAYFTSSHRLAGTYKWSRHGISFPSAWPDQASELAAQFDSSAKGAIRVEMIRVQAVNRLPPGPGKDTLAGAGIRSWIGVLGVSPLGACGLLGFDALRSSIKIPPSDLQQLRMAFDAIVNALARDRLEDESARLEAQLQQSRRMETVGALASGVAHNFNNIVGAILGYTEIAESQVPPHSGAARSLSEIRDASARARDLIDQILAFGRRREGQQARLRFNALLAEAKSLLEASLPSGIELVIRDTPDTHIRGEASQLQQIILNLCHNAAQAMDNAGRIEIRAEIRDVKEEVSLANGKLAPNRYAVISVRDTGRGMTKAIMARIFEPFFTTRSTGNGLGLATACEIVREHGGAIDVDSAPGTGSCFEVWLPCQFNNWLMAERPSSISLPLGRGETVLVIDDERDRLLRDEEMLAALGYEPVGFVSANDAVAACQARPDRFDGLLVAHLPSVPSALSAAAALHNIAPDRPILLAAASTSEIDASALVTAGVSHIMRWPLIASELASALKQCLGTQARPAAATIET